jgi:WhiB family redox-sensing transcriptional regulator
MPIAASREPPNEVSRSEYQLRSRRLRAAEPSPGSVALLFGPPRIRHPALHSYHLGLGPGHPHRRRHLGVTQMFTGPFEDVLAQALRRSLEVPCLQVDPELFFADSPDDVETAKAMCADCPVRSACLSAALERREPWGVWGAELFVQGTVVARKRPRGRPRKEIAA